MSPLPPSLPPSRKFCAPRSIFFSYGAIFEVIITRVACFQFKLDESSYPLWSLGSWIVFDEDAHHFTRPNEANSHPGTSPLCSNVCPISAAIVLLLENRRYVTRGGRFFKPPRQLILYAIIDLIVSAKSSKHSFKGE